MTITTLVHLETAKKFNKVEKKILTVGWGLIYLADMPNEPAVDKVILSFQVPAPTVLRLKKLMKKHGYKNLSPFCAWILYKETENVELTAKDYEEITEIIRSNEKRRRSRRGGGQD